MKLNELTALVGSKCFLVPYKRRHVEKYHQWMESEELRELTASERLTIEQEYQMQEQWHVDENKCTFIILERIGSILPKGEDEISAMVGDVNLFIEDKIQAELEIMIAEPGARGKGIGKQACLAMMLYGIREIGIKLFSTKIGLSNTTSINLFQGLGFTEVSRSDVFKEVTLELAATDQLDKALSKLDDYELTHYYSS